MRSCGPADPIPLLENDARRLRATATDIARRYPVCIEDALHELLLGHSPERIEAGLRLRAMGLRL